jgi:LPXTG-motif cell wall-anchored protein
MMFALWLLWLFQEAAEGSGGPDNTTRIQIVAGVLALVLVVIILVRRKKKASKEDWS